MKSLSLGQTKELVGKAMKMDENRKRERIVDKFNTQRMVGAVSGLVAAPVAGYLSAKLDTQFDATSGDGIAPFGIPAVPLAGGLLAGLGWWMGGTTGAALEGAGLATAYGGLFQIGYRKGGS